MRIQFIFINELKCMHVYIIIILIIIIIIKKKYIYI